MSVHITYFVHASTTDSEHGIATGWLPGELSQRGRDQARDLGRSLQGQDFDAVYCSDLARALESAQLVFGDRYELRPDSRLRECNYGELNGTSAATFKDRLAEYIDMPFPGGESYLAVQLRVGDFLTDVQSQWDGRRIAVVGHQAPQLALDVLIGGRSWEQAIEQDWRPTGAWQPGWEYVLATT